MAEDRYSVELGIGFESLPSVEAKLEKIVKSISKSKQVELGINASNLKDLMQDVDKINKKTVKIFSDGETKKITEIQSGLKNTLKIIEDSKNGLSADIISNPLKAQKQLYSELNKLQQNEFNIRQKLLTADGQRSEIYKQMLATARQMQTELGKTINSNGLNDAKSNNELLQRRINLTNNLKIAQIDLNEKQAADIAKMEEAMRKREEAQAKQTSNQQRLQYEEQLKQQLAEQKNLYNELNQLQNNEMSIKKQLVTADGEALEVLKRQLEVNKQKQQEVGNRIADKNLESEKLINEVLTNRRKLQDDLDVAQAKRNDKVAKEQQDVQKLIELERKRLTNRIDNAQDSKYGKYLDSAQVTKYRQEIERLNGTSLKDVRNQVRNLNEDFNQMANQARTQQRVVEGGFLGSINQALGKFGVYFSTAMIGRAIINTFKEARDSVINLDSSMVALKKVTEETEATYNKFLDTTHKTALKLGTTTKDFVEATTLWAKTGEELATASKLAENTIILSNVGDVNVQQAQEYLVAPIKAFNIEAEKTMGLINILNATSNASANDVENLGESLKRSASSMAVAGNSIEQTTALLATANEATQLGGENSFYKERLLPRLFSNEWVSRVYCR